MTRDSERWIDTGPPPEVLRLLVAARHRAPPASAVERAVEAARVAAAPAAAAAGFSLVGAAGKSAPGWLRWGALGSGGALLLAGAIAARSGGARYSEVEQIQVLERGAARVEPRLDSLPSSKRDAPADQAASRGIPERQPAAAALGVAPAEHSRQPAAAAVRGSPIVGRAAPETAVTSSTTPALSDVEKQIELLVRARRAVDGAKPRQALNLLDYCARSFETQYFTPEALLLRYRAWRVLGAFDAATRAERQLSRTYPASPQARQVALLEKARVALR